MDFDYIKIEDKACFLDLLKDNPLYVESSYEQCFETLFCFSEDLLIKVSIDSDRIVILSEEHGQKVFYPPITHSKEGFIEAIKACIDYSTDNGFPFVLEGITPVQKAVIESDNGLYVHFEPDRSNYEYLYLPSEFISYNPRLQAFKIAQLKGFEKRYGSNRRPYERKDLPEVELLFKEWLGKRNITEYDYAPMLKALKNIDKLGLFATCLTADGKIIGLSIGKIDEKNVGTVLFEKAEHKYFGAYAALVSYFVRDHMSNCRYINRQEDMGIEGLRRSKLSYLVERFIVKYKMTLGYVYRGEQ